jgi:hypothetical protein
LILTVIILALAGTVMTGLCRASFNRAARSVAAEEELRRRWGVASCQRTFLPSAEQIIAAAEVSHGRAVPIVRQSIILDGITYELTFGDEAAKLDVNALVQARGKAQAETAVKDLLRQTGCSARPHLLAGKPQKILKPIPALRKQGGSDEAGNPSPAAPAETADQEEPRPLQSFGQVFPGADPADLLGIDGNGGAAMAITCWGDGRLHFRRASDAALRQFCPPTLNSGQTTRLIRLRAKSPAQPATELLDQLQLSDDAIDGMDARLVEESECHSLWVVATTERRRWYHLAILDQTGGSDQVVLFSW